MHDCALAGGHGRAIELAYALLRVSGRGGINGSADRDHHCGGGT
jgi:hypothetical protein